VSAGDADDVVSVFLGYTEEDELGVIRTEVFPFAADHDAFTMAGYTASGELRHWTVRLYSRDPRKHGYPMGKGPGRRPPIPDYGSSDPPRPSVRPVTDAPSVDPFL